MSTASKSQYDLLMEIRPYKFTKEQVDYKESEDNDVRCGTCEHMYRRITDSFSVCEIYRDDETDKVGIDPDYVCQFQTADRIHFPLLDE